MLLERLGPYTIRRTLGRGGMGTVYEGFNKSTGETAAVKVLSSILAADDAFRERFEAEIETLKALKHQNIVQLHGYGEQEGHLFYVMELIEGTSLEEELRNGRRFQWREVICIGIDICRALKHAHDCGVIHRDLKPANLLLSREEQVKLTDFGIAKLFGHAQMTAQGGVLGTADYMAPEQAEGRPVTPRSDLYGVGSVLYALLTGRPPFRGKSMADVLHMLRYADPAPVRNLAPEAPAALEKIIMQLLEKDPQKRIPTALALSNVLQATEHALSIHPTPDDTPDQNTEYEQDVSALTNATLVNATVPMDPKTLLSSQGSADPASIATPDEQGISDEQRPQSSESHFTTVDEHDLGRRREQFHSHEEYVGTWVKATAFVLVGVCVALVVWYVSQPLSADQLYARVKQIIDTKDDYKLLQSKDKLRSFVEQFPEDKRCDEIRGLLEKMDVARLENRLTKRAHSVLAFDELAPAERHYLEIIQISSPEKRLARLRALVDVFGNRDDVTKPTRDCLRLVNRQIAVVEESIQRASDRHLAAIDASLKRAEELRRSDLPAAIRIWRGITQLYSEKPWAQTLVEVARQELDTAQPEGGSSQ